MFNVISGFILDLLNFQTDIYYYYYLLPRIENKFFLFMYVNKIWSSNLSCWSSLKRNIYFMLWYSYLLSECNYMEVQYLRPYTGTSTKYKRHMVGTGPVCILDKAMIHSMLSLDRSDGHLSWPVSAPQNIQDRCQYRCSLMHDPNNMPHLDIHGIVASILGDRRAWQEPSWLL